MALRFMSLRFVSLRLQAGCMTRCATTWRPMPAWYEAHLLNPRFSIRLRKSVSRQAWLKGRGTCLLLRL